MVRDRHKPERSRVSSAPRPLRPAYQQYLGRAALRPGHMAPHEAVKPPRKDFFAAPASSARAARNCGHRWRPDGRAAHPNLL